MISLTPAKRGKGKLCPVINVLSNPILLVQSTNLVRPNGSAQKISCGFEAFQSMTVGEGLFNINRTETNIFTMEFSLHHKCDEEFALYEYTMGGDGEYMTMFDHIFNFGWENNIASLSSRSQPVKRISMMLTDKLNGCKISCSLQP